MFRDMVIDEYSKVEPAVDPIKAESGQEWLRIEGNFSAEVEQ